MARLCFVSYEIAPTTKGGAGVLLRNLTEALLSAGHEVILVLDLPPWEFDAFSSRDRFALPGSGRCRAYHVGSLVDGHRGPVEADFPSHFAWRAYRFHVACSLVYAAERPDLIEFFDYGGVGHYALSSKVAGLDYDDARLAVRLHTSLELMDRVSGEVELDSEREFAYALEHGALRLAETVLYPTPSYLDEAYLPYYEPWFGQLVESPPPIVDVPARRRPWPNQNVVLYYGRLSGLKGVDLFIDAALAMIHDEIDEELVFYLVGFDPVSPDAAHEAGTNLRRRIPVGLEHRFVFTGQWGRERLERLLPRVRFAVFPTYLESFGYAAHEIRAAGVPVLLSSIPAFHDHFVDERDALFFDGTVQDLHRQMRRLDQDRKLRDRLGESSTPPITTSLSFYEASSESWIAGGQTRSPNGVGLLICVLADDPAKLDETLATIDGSDIAGFEVLVIRPVEEAAEGTAFWFLGRLCTVESRDGTTLEPTAVVTLHSLLLLRAGDSLQEGFVGLCLGILDRQPEIGYAGTWKSRAPGVIDTFPLDLMPESTVLLGGSALTRCVMRTEPDRLLIDLFDRRAGMLGETTYISTLPPGLVVPDVQLKADDASVLSPRSPEDLSHAVVSDEEPLHTKRFARLLASALSSDGTLPLRMTSKRREADRLPPSTVETPSRQEETP